MLRSGHSFRGQCAFTLLEVLMVVVLLGIIAGIVVVLYRDLESRTKQSAFVTSLKIMATQAHIYHTEHGQWLEDSDSGAMPSGFEAYVLAQDWNGGTPIGGSWDVEGAGDFAGVVSAIGVHFQGGDDMKDDAYMAEVDASFDDGNLSSGAFQKIGAGRFYYIIARQ